ncbi:MAG: tetratricopeptide repeat protein [bacterium]|nr:tetratricopeptide repeat protein [bacterium]
MSPAWACLLVALLVRPPAGDPLIHFSDLREAARTAPPRHGGALLSFRELRPHGAEIVGRGERCRVAIARFPNAGKTPEHDWLSRELAASLKRLLEDRSPHEFVLTDLPAPPPGDAAGRPGSSGGAARVESLARRTRSDVVIAGGYAVLGNRVEVHVRAVRPSTGEMSAPLRFEGTLDRIGELEGRLAAGVGGALGIRLSDEALGRLDECPTLSAAAFEEYCRGLQAPDGSHTKIRHFQRAIETDPSFAEARYLLGNAYAGIGMTYGYVEWYNMALEEYRHAAALEPGDARVFCAMGLVYFVNGQYELARRSLEEALRLDPEMKLARGYLHRLDAMGQ